MTSDFILAHQKGNYVIERKHDNTDRDHIINISYCHGISTISEMFDEQPLLLTTLNSSSRLVWTCLLYPQLCNGPFLNMQPTYFGPQCTCQFACFQADIASVWNRNVLSSTILLRFQRCYQHHLIMQCKNINRNPVEFYLSGSGEELKILPTSLVEQSCFWLDDQIYVPHLINY